jgi:hypothetical protein
LLVTALIFLFASVGVTFALEKGNKRKGKYTYRKVYKACMERGEVDSPKPPISPDAKTQAQWTRTFEKKDFAGFWLQTGMGRPVGGGYHRHLHLSA